MINRRQILVTAAAAASSAVYMPAILRAQTMNGRKVVLGIGSAAQQVVNLPLNVARARNYFVEEGVDVEFLEFGSGSKGVQALVSGGAEIVCGAYEHVLRMQAKNIDIKDVVLFNKATSVAMGVSKDFQSKYKSVADLKGAKVGVTAPGSASHYFLELLLSRHGMSSADVSVIGVGGALGAAAAVRSGSVDAIVNYDPLISELENAGDIRIVVDTRTVEGTKELYGNEYMFVCLYTSQDYINAKPEETQACVNAIVRALIWLRTANPDEILASIPSSYRQVDPELYKKTIIANFGGLSRDGRGSIAAASSVYNNLKEFDQNLKNANIDLNKTFENKFVEVALGKLDK